MKTQALVFIAWIAMLLSASVASGAEDWIGLIRINEARRSNPLFLHVHAADGPVDAFVGTAKAGVSRLGKLRGSRPVHSIFPADWDGDGVDELLVVRERRKKQDGPLDLSVHRRPADLHSRLGPKLASSVKRDLGYASGPERVTALGAADTDGDGRDELLTVRAGLSDTLSLEIRRLPSGRRREMGDALASCADLGSDRIVSLFGADLFGDAADELVLLRRDGLGRDRLEVFDAPATAVLDLGAPLASYPDVTPAAPFQNLSAGRFHSDDLHPNGLLLVQSSEGGAERLLAFALPQTVGAVLGAPIRSDDQPGAPVTGAPIFASFAITPPLDLGSLLDGPWLFRIAWSEDDGGGDFPHWGPAPEFPAVAWVDGSRLILDILSGPKLIGQIQDINWPNVTIQFPTTDVNFVFPDGTGTATFSLGTAQLTEPSPGILVINADCGGTCTVTNSSGSWPIDALSFSKL